MADEKARHQSFWQDIFRETFVAHVLPWIIKGAAQSQTDARAEKAKRARNKHYFAAALVKLRMADAHAAEVVDDFVDHYLNNDADREDFQHNAAKVGTDEDNKMDDTVEFLRQLAQLPDHPTREVHLTALGFIGARSVDMREKAVAMLKSVRDTVKGLPAGAKQKIDQGIQALKALDDKQWMQDAERSSAASRQTAANRLADYKARRRS